MEAVRFDEYGGVAFGTPSHITVFPGGSHLTLISHPNAVSAVIASAICSVH